MNILCLGKRRLGKTTLAGSIAHFHKPDQPAPRVVILDTRNQFRAADPITRLPAQREEVFKRLEEKRETIVQASKDLHTCSLALEEIIRQWVILEDGPEGDHFRNGKLSVILDDVGLEKVDIAEWDWHFRGAPHDQTRYILTAHRPTDIHPDIRALADWWCIFRTTEVRDLKAIEERCGERVKNLVTQLQPRQFILWDDSTSDPKEQIQEYRDPKVWFYPLNKAADGERDRPLVSGVPSLREQGDLLE